MSGVSEREALREAIGSVIGRWYKVRLLRFNSGDDGSDDLLLRDEIARAVEPLIDAERDRVRVLAAAVPDDPMTPFRGDAARRCSWCRHGRHNSRFVHAHDCPWLIAKGVRDSLESEA